MRVKYKYLMALMVVSPIELTFTAVYSTIGSWDAGVVPGIAANLFFLVFVNALGGYWIMKPVRHYFWAGGSYRDAMTRVNKVPMWSAVWVGLVTIPFCLVKYWFVPEVLQLGQSVAGTAEQLLTMVSVHTLYFGYLTYFIISLLRSTEAPEVFSSYYISSKEVHGRVALKVFVIILISALLPQWTILTEVKYMMAWEERQSLLQVLLVSIVAVTISIICASQFYNHSIKVLRTGVQRYMRGEHGVRLPVTSQDEYGALISSFNDMVDRLRERRYEREIAGKLVSRHVAAGIRGQGAYQGEGSVLATASLVHLRLVNRQALIHVSPEDLIKLMNKIWRHFEDVARHYGGVVMLAGSQSALVTFNIPQSSLDHAHSALSFAEKAVHELKHVCSEHPQNGQVSVCAGVHTGQVMMGVVMTEGMSGEIIAGPTRDYVEALSLQAEQTGQAILVDQSTVDLAGAQASMVKVDPADQTMVSPLMSQAERGVYASAS